MAKLYTGGCLCNSLRYQFKTKPQTVYICHCTECQKVSSSAFGMSVRVNGDDFNITRGTSKIIKTTADSDRTKEGLFCPECGNRISSKPTSGNFVIVKAGTLDNPNWFRPVAHIWTRSAQSWFSFLDGLPKFEQAPDNSDELNRLWSNHVSGTK
jgi:hypothetical protein